MVAAGIQLVSVFLLFGVDGFLTGGGFYPSPPHTHTNVYTFTHAHTHTKQVVCPVEAQAPCHLDLLGSAETPPTSRKEREENFPLRKRVSSCCLWLNHESDATNPSPLQPVCFFSLCVVCVSAKLSNFWISQWTKQTKKPSYQKCFSAVAPTIG